MGADALALWAPAGVSVAAVTVSSVVALARCRLRSPLGVAASVMLPLSQAALVLFVTWTSWRIGVGRGYAYLAAACVLVCAAVNPPLLRGIELAEGREAAAVFEREVERQLSAQRAHLERALEVSEGASALARSLSSLFRETSRAIGDGDTGRARELLGAAAEMVPPAGESYCANPAVDALLAAKAALGERDGVSLEVDASVPADLRLPAVETCAVLSNLIDNAMSAASRLPEGERSVGVRVAVAGGCLAIAVRNRFEPAPPERSSRRGGSLGEGLPEHGWGLSIVSGIARRHDGSFVTERKGGEYVARVLLPLGR